MAEMTEQRQGEPEQMGFTILVDFEADACASAPPLAVVLEEIRQALAARNENFTVNICHAFIREPRDEMLAAYEAITDEISRHG